MNSVKVLNGGSHRKSGDDISSTADIKEAEALAAASRREYEILTVDQLRKLLKRRSLKQQGNKFELIKRLQDSDYDSETSNSKMSVNSPKSTKSRRSRSRSTSRSRVANTSITTTSSADEPSETTNGDFTLTQRLIANGTHDDEGKSAVNATDAASGKRKSRSQPLSAKQREEEIEAKLQTISILRSPLLSLLYFVRELGYYSMRLLRKLQDISSLLTLRNLVGCLTIALFCALVYLFGWQERIEWYAYWCFLGILSSVGLGTGLHTFLLYLGPFIARVTIAAFECGTTDFLEPPFPHDIVCPDSNDSLAASNASQNPADGMDAAHHKITLLMLMSKVRWEAIFWGAGTAIGELPPYFVSRSARLAGSANEAEFEEEIRTLETRVQQQVATPFERAQFFVYNVIRRVGFWGILVCASIPNPLFDLAGITCGHFLIPFSTFFGATLIGKAIVKMHLQQLFVIIAFSEHHVDLVLDLTARIPFVGARIREPLARYLSDQRAKFHGKVVPEETWVQAALTWFVYAIIAFFVLSIINSLARANYRRELEAEMEDSEAEKKKDADGKKRKVTSPSSNQNSRSRANRNRLDD